MKLLLKDTLARLKAEHTLVPGGNLTSSQQGESLNESSDIQATYKYQVLVQEYPKTRRFPMVMEAADT